YRAHGPGTAPDAVVAVEAALAWGGSGACHSMTWPQVEAALTRRRPAPCSPAQGAPRASATAAATLRPGPGSGRAVLTRRSRRRTGVPAPGGAGRAWWRRPRSPA